MLPPVITVEITAIIFLLLGTVTQPAPAYHELDAMLLVCILGVLHNELAGDIERVRRRMAGGELHVDLGSVWFFAAAVLLPPGYAALTTVLLHTHLWLRSGYKRAPLYRQVFNSAAMLLSAFAAAAAMRYITDVTAAVALGRDWNVLVLVVGILVFITVNSALVAGAIAVSSSNASLTQMLGHMQENLLELATLSMGALVAVSFSVVPWLVLFILPPLLVLHRAVLVRHLEEAASTDGKTGLLTAAAWHSQAERALRKFGRNDGPRGVLVLDIDHFKRVNDTHGHLAGDVVLAAVADALRAEVRDRDLVGRFGGEEFVVLLSGLEGSGTVELQAVAERIRRRVAELRVEIPTPDGPLTVAGLSISIGAALHPGLGGDLRTLLQIADAALYSAKRAGRNAVRVGEALPEPSPAPADDIVVPPPWGALGG